MQLTQKEIYRYVRHFPVIGITGQKKLKSARILCIGAGGLGCSTLQYLTAAGVGHITAVDGDKIECSNLQRQILYNENDLQKNKAETAILKLKLMNSAVQFSAINEYLDEKNADALLQDCDIVVDGSDNFSTRYLVNRFARFWQKPLVSASIYEFQAQMSTYNYQNGPCYECLYPQAPPKEMIPNCALGGVLGALPGVIGSLQATEVIKLITGIGENLSGHLLSINLHQMNFKTYQLKKAPHCSRDACSHVNPFTHQRATIIKPLPSIDAIKLKKMRDDQEIFFLLDVRQPYEYEICHIKGSVLIPLDQIKQRLQEIPLHQKIILYCKAGQRGQKAAQLLEKLNYTNVYNLTGGIISWITNVENQLMRY